MNKSTRPYWISELVARIVMMQAAYRIAEQFDLDMAHVPSILDTVAKDMAEEWQEQMRKQ
jgi:hypothetical protein